MLIDRRHNFHASFFVYVFITLLVGLGAFNSQNNLLFWAFGFALSVLLVSGVISWHVLRGLRVHRETPPRATVGEPLTFRFALSKRARVVPSFALSISEIVPDPTTAPPLAPAPHALRLVRPRRQSVAGREVFAFVAHLSPRGSAAASAVYLPERRGMLRLSDFAVQTGFPFGIVRKSLVFREPRTIVVRPCPIAPPPGVLSPRRLADTSGVPRTVLAGGGDEFFTLREYAPGDSPRAVAWRASARADRMLVRQNTPPTPRRLRILLRLDRELPPEQNERAISLAAGLINEAASAGFEIGLTVPLLALDRRPAPGRATAARLLDDLALLDLQSPSAGAAAAFPSRSPRGTLCVVIHAGASDRRLGPADAVHLSAVDNTPGERANARPGAPQRLPAGALGQGGAA